MIPATASPPSTSSASPSTASTPPWITAAPASSRAWKAGLKEGVDFEVDYRNADFDDTMTTQIGDAFSAEDVDPDGGHRHQPPLWPATPPPRTRTFP